MTNLGPSASASAVSAADAGARSLASAIFSASPCTATAPSRLANLGDLAARTPKTSNAFASTWKTLSSKPGKTASARIVSPAAAPTSSAGIASTAAATAHIPCTRSFQLLDWSLATVSAEYVAVIRSMSSSFDAGDASATSASASDEDSLADAPGRLDAAVPGLGRDPLPLLRTPGAGLTAIETVGLLETLTSLVRRGAGFVDADADDAPHISSILAFLASSSVSIALATDLNPPHARAIPAMASSAAALTSGLAASVHLTTPGRSAFCAAAAGAPFISPHAAAIHSIVCCGTLGILCESAARTSSATSASEKQCVENSSSAS